MSILSAEALDKLLCSSCHKYLSVFPVKVNPDKSVQCGRCSTAKEQGVQSILCEMIAEKCKFPCTNLFVGCRAELDPDGMKIHEERDCEAEHMICPCCDIDINTNDVLHHVKSTHKDKTLEQPAFWIDLNQWLVQKIYFYRRGNDFMNVGFKYTANTEELILYFKIYRKDGDNLRHKFRLYFVNNNIHYETAEIKSAESGLSDDCGITIDLTKHNYPKNAVLCMFDLWDATEKPQTCADAEYPVMDGKANKALAIFKINRICSLKVSELYFSEFGYSIDSKFWRLAIEKVEDVAGVPHIAVYLLQQPVNNLNQRPCVIVAKISLISSMNQDLNVVRNIKGDLKLTEEWPNFLNWNTLVNPQNGYVMDDSIQFEVSLEILPSK